MRTLLFLFAGLIFFTLNAGAQRSCGTVEKLREEKLKDPSLETRLQTTENEIQKWIAAHRSGSGRAIVTIPVVVHVVHNGEAVGTGTNISDAQIYSQLAIMNDMFRLKNADTLPSSHPFGHLQADCGMEFCLAQQDEFGNPTTGIERINGGQADWTRAQLEATLQPATIWNRDLYLNLWTAKFGGSNSTLTGYGQMPGAGPASTDGVVISYSGFGNVGNVIPPFQYGKSCAHDIGHWLSLHHISYGTMYCEDLVADTPPAQNQNYGCPVFPHNPFNGCGSGADGEMFMNYMDYVDDACMVMFSKGQADRMNAVLNGVRSSLLTSPGCLTPATAVYESKRKNDLLVYPNPSMNGRFRVQSLGFNIDKVDITDVTGRKIKTLNIEQGTLNLSEMGSGVYFLNIFHDSMIITKPIIIQ